MEIHLRRDDVWGYVAKVETRIRMLGTGTGNNLTKQRRHLDDSQRC